MYFRSITSRPSYCKAHVRAAVGADARPAARRRRTRTLTYITPDLCHDAHDARCADGGPGGLRAANSWFKTWVPRILRSPAFRPNGMLVITADESEGVDARTHAPAAARAPARTPASPASRARAEGGSAPW